VTMDKRTPVILVAVALIIIVLFVNFGGVWNQPPSDHQLIIDNVKIHDIDFDTWLTPHYIDSRRSCRLTIVSLGVFTPKTREYQVSEWIYRTDTDPNMAVELWGPGNDGVTYELRLAKLMGNTVEITFFNVVYGEERFTSENMFIFEFKLVNGQVSDVNIND